MRILSFFLVIATLFLFAACVSEPDDSSVDDSDITDGMISNDGGASNESNVGNTDKDEDENKGENKDEDDNEGENKDEDDNKGENKDETDEGDKELTMENSLLSMCGSNVTYKEVPEYDPVGEFAGIKAITYDGAMIGSSKTKVFAYLGFPEGASAENPVPAVVLVHGSQNGIPYAKWVKEWNNRGYAAISMSTNNFFPKNNTAGDREYSGELSNWNVGLYGVFEEEGYVTAPRNEVMSDSDKHYSQMWMYHAVSDCILAGNLLRADARVNSELVGICGISWGATVTSIAIGYDSSYAFAIPIYGSGYLTEAHTVFANVFGKDKNPEYWLAEKRFDNADMPILWLCMNNDTPFSMNSNIKSYLHTFKNNEETRLAAINGWAHSHGSGWSREEAYAFADSVCGKAPRMPKLVLDGKQPTLVNPDNVDIMGVTLFYLTEEYAYKNGTPPTWQYVNMNYNNGEININIPDNAKTCYYQVAFWINGKGVATTTEMFDLLS